MKVLRSRPFRIAVGLIGLILGLIWKDSLMGLAGVILLVIAFIDKRSPEKN